MERCFTLQFNYVAKNIFHHTQSLTAGTYSPHSLKTSILMFGPSVAYVKMQLVPSARNLSNFLWIKCNDLTSWSCVMIVDSWQQCATLSSLCWHMQSSDSLVIEFLASKIWILLRDIWMIFFKFMSVLRNFWWYCCCFEIKNGNHYDTSAFDVFIY